METKRVILARFVDLMLRQQTCYRGNRMSDFPKNSFFVGNSTIFLVNNGHRAIKVHVNKV